MRYENSLLINAPASVVWDLTLDVSRWPEMTPTMQRVEPLDPAPLAVGHRARVKQPMQPSAIWTVSELEPLRSFVWRTERGRMTWIGAHRIEEVDDDSCRNILSIEMTGRGAKPFTLLFGPMLRRAIRQENEGFRKAAERHTAEGDR